VKAEIFVLGQGGLVMHGQTTSTDKVSLSGYSKAVGVGFRSNFLEFETVYFGSSSEADIMHDNQKNKILHTQSSLIVAMNFYLKKALYFRFGYGFHHLKQSLEKEMSPASTEGALREYNIRSDLTTGALIYGAGICVYETKRLSFFTQFENHSYRPLKAQSWNVSLGVRMHFE
jgi:hypothetical protein